MEPLGVGGKGSSGCGGRSGSNLSLHDVDVLTNLIYLHVTTPLHRYQVPDLSQGRLACPTGALSRPLLK